MFFLILWIVILGSMLVVYLLYPILSRNQVFPEMNPIEARIQTLTLEREQSYSALADLDEDYETGKLSDKDYQDLRSALMQETADIVSQLETAAEMDVESEIERYKLQKQK